MSDAIEQLLSETDLAGDDRLRELLVDLEDGATSIRPVPSAELAALLVPARPARAGRSRRGMIITTLVIAGTLAGGATAAAASPDVRSAVGGAVRAVVAAVLPATHDAPASPGSPRSTPAPSPSRTTGSGKGNASAHPDPTTRPHPSTGSGSDGQGAARGDAGIHPTSGSHPTGPPSGTTHGRPTPKP